MAALLITLIVVATLHHVRGTSYSFWFVLYTPPFALIVFCLASGSTVLSPILGCRSMVLLGEASYSFYLIHALFLELLSGIFPPVIGHALDAPLWAIAITFVLCTLTSIASLKLIELPARLWMRSALQRFFLGPSLSVPVDMVLAEK